MVSLLAAAAVSCTREIQAPDGEEATLTVTWTTGPKLRQTAG